MVDRSQQSVVSNPASGGSTNNGQQSEDKRRDLFLSIVYCLLPAVYCLLLSINPALAGAQGGRGDPLGRPCGLCKSTSSRTDMVRGSGESDFKPEDFLQMRELVRPVAVVREARALNLPQPALERSEGAEKGNLAEKPPGIQSQDYYFDVEAVKMKKVQKWLEFHGFVSMTDPLHGRDDPTQRKNVNFIDQTWITFWLGAHIYKTLSFTGEVDIENSFEVEAEKGHFDWNVWGDRVSLRAGKFVYPFGIERLAYSAPFNKLVDRPSPSVRILPGTYSDVGLQFYGTLHPPHVHALKYELAVTNGLDHYNEEGKQEDLQDNNSNKQLGGRLALAPLSWIEIGGSYLTGKYDRHNHHRLYLAGADLRLQRGGLELRGEYMIGRVEAVGGGTSPVMDTISRPRITALWNGITSII
ncbi:MAG: hypothetical protein Q6354_06210 [Candidatus Brocadiales bacterium]|nr:hypothetical protein [Candidatus Brocadiales bacterium]